MSLRLLTVLLLSSTCLAQPQLEAAQEGDTTRAVVDGGHAQLEITREGAEQALGLKLRQGPGMFSCQRTWSDEGWSARLQQRLASDTVGMELTENFEASEWSWQARAWANPGPIYLAARLDEGELADVLAGVRYAGFDTGLEWAEAGTSWKAGFSRWGLRCGAKGSLMGWETPWRQYEVDYKVQVTESVSVGAGVSRKLEGDTGKDSSRGSVEVRF